MTSAYDRARNFLDEAMVEVEENEVTMREIRAGAVLDRVFGDPVHDPDTWVSTDVFEDWDEHRMTHQPMPAARSTHEVERRGREWVESRQSIERRRTRNDFESTMRVFDESTDGITGVEVTRESDGTMVVGSVWRTADRITGLLMIPGLLGSSISAAADIEQHRQVDPELEALVDQVAMQTAWSRDLVRSVIRGERVAMMMPRRHGLSAFALAMGQLHDAP